MSRIIYALAGVCFALAESVFAQDAGPRILQLDERGMYAEALAQCLREVKTSPVAQYFAGDYYFHGRKGIERDEVGGRAYYLKALEGLLPLAEAGDATAQYRVARCLEFGTAYASRLDAASRKSRRLARLVVARRNRVFQKRRPDSFVRGVGCVRNHALFMA